MKRVLLLLLTTPFLYAPIASFSQVQDAWVKTGLGFFGNSSQDPGLVLDGNGNIIAGVNAQDFAPGDMAGLVSIFSLTKYTPAGNLVFDIVESAQPYNKHLVDMAVDNVGNIYCAVRETRSLDPSIGRSGALFAVYKYSPTGAVLWKRSYGEGDYSSPNAIAVDAAGNVYLTGQNKLDGRQLTDVLPDYMTVKWNSSGDRQWVRKYDGASPGEGLNIAHDIIVDGSGNVFITGQSQRDGQVGYATLKYNSAGTELWAVRYNGLNTGTDRGLALTRDVNGFIYVTGSSEGAIATIKYNTDGAQIWIQREGTVGAEGKSIKVDGSGNVFVAGDGSSTQMILLKLNFTGVKQWASLRSGSGYALDIDGYGNSYISGTVNNDAAVLKLNASGVQQWIKTYDSPLRTGIMNPIAVADLENVYVIRFTSFNRDGNANPYYNADLMKFTQCDIVCPADITINTSSGECTGVVNYTVGITGECGSNIAYSQPTGTALPVGTTIVAVVDIVTGEHCSFNVTVRDAEAPQARCNNITLTLDATGNASLSAAQIDNKSSDNCGIQSLSINKTVFTCADIGANTVAFTVTDINGNTASCAATVTVQDYTPPVARCRNPTIYLDANGNANITGAQIDNGSSDACGAVTLGLSRTSFTCADKGTRTVVLTVTDAYNNAATCSATVTVVDNTPPVITSLNANPGYIWPADRKMKNVTLSATVSDNCSGATWAVTDIVIKAGVFDNDIINPDHAIAAWNKVRLRAEPPFSGVNRIYTITITASDAAGNTSTASIDIEVTPDLITLRNGDTPGLNMVNENDADAAKPDITVIPLNDFTVSIFPNPGIKHFIIQVSGIKHERVVIMHVTDINGRMIETKTLTAHTPTTFGELYRSGMYPVRIIQGKVQKEIKLIKLTD